MAKQFKHPSRAVAERTAELLNRVSGYPKRGTQVGTSPEKIPDVYTPGAFGWTARAVEALGDHPETPTEYRVKIPEEIEAHAKDPAQRARLTKAERDELDEKLAALEVIVSPRVAAPGRK